MKYLKLWENFNNEEDIIIEISTEYSHDHAERFIDNLDETYGIMATFIDINGSGNVILEVYPTDRYDGSYYDFLNFIDSHEAVNRIISL